MGKVISSKNANEQKDNKFLNGLKKFGKGIMPNLSKLSKAFLLPIALLPIAGVFLGVGAAISTNSVAGSFGFYFGSVLNKMGDVCFGNLPILFCISVALAYTKDSGVAAICAVVGFLVLNGMQAALLHTKTVDHATVWVLANGKWHQLYTQVEGAWTIDWAKLGFGLQDIERYVSNPGGLDLSITENLDKAISINANRELIDGAGTPFYSLLWIDKIPNGLIASNVGIKSLNTGVLAGIFVGAIAAWCYNKFHATQLPAAISFFSGTKLVPIVTFGAVIPLSLIFMFIWPYLGLVLGIFGQASGKLPIGLDSLIFEVVERSLVPFGLHHVFYAPLWWTNAGGAISEAFNSAEKNFDLQAKFVEIWLQGHNKEILGGLEPTFENIKKVISRDYKDLWEAMGDQTIAYKVIANAGILNFKDLDVLGLNIGRFQAGKFGFMLFGLPMAGVAMWLNVPKENRKSVMGIYFSAAFTCFLTGITEPIEYTFLFLAPWLFYGVHMPLAAISFMLAGFLRTHISMTVSGGFIDYIVFGVIPFASNNIMSAKSCFGILGVGLGMAGLYFTTFYFAVKYGKVMVPGRDGSTNAKLATKADYKEAKEKEAMNQQNAEIGVKTTKNDAEEARTEKARKIIEFLGNEQNIIDVDACASRLRVTIKDVNLVDKDGIMSLGGANGILIRGNSVQVIYGGEQEAIKPRMNKILEEMRNNKN